MARSRTPISAVAPSPFPQSAETKPASRATVQKARRARTRRWRTRPRQTSSGSAEAWLVSPELETTSCCNQPLMTRFGLSRGSPGEGTFGETTFHRSPPTPVLTQA